MERNRKIWMQILVLAAVLRFFPFDFQTAVSTASEDVAAECAGGEEQKPKIALTFDDGPNIKYTPMLLDGLKERRAGERNKGAILFCKRELPF